MALWVPPKTFVSRFMARYWIRRTCGMHAEPGVSKYSTIFLLRTRNYLPGPLIFPVQIDITLHSKDQEKVHLEKCLQSVDLQITTVVGMVGLHHTPNIKIVLDGCVLD